ncbi:dephospho-CoA kinase [Bacteroidia bacterium]|nr:dephospho-CoA kinase [Bacteroidia bacterium]
MPKIGITGGIGSGKSVVSSLLHVMGVPVYIADDESKRLANTSPVIRAKLVNLLGENIYSGGSLNKQLLASLIFNNRELLHQVNAIIHPEVNKHFLQWASNGPSLCAIETAILFESGFDRAVDVSILVYAPLELRLRRVMSRDGSDRESIISRINNQMPDDEKKMYAHYIIYNDGKQALIPQLAEILRAINN